MVCDTKINNSDTDTARFISPPVDIFETEEGLQVMADLPGVEIDDVEIQVEEDRLIIKGQTSYAPENTGSLHREFRLVNFQRQFELDNEVDRDKISASVKDGVLTIGLPRAEKVKPRRIEVKVA